MAFTDVDLAYLRTRLGSTVDEDLYPEVVDDLETRYDRLHDIKLIVVEVLRQRLADIADGVNSPLNFTIPGEYAQDATANVAFLQKMLMIAEREAGVSGLFTVEGIDPSDDRWRKNFVIPGGVGKQRVWAYDVERFPYRGYYGGGYGR